MNSHCFFFSFFLCYNQAECNKQGWYKSSLCGMHLFLCLFQWLVTVRTPFHVTLWVEHAFVPLVSLAIDVRHLVQTVLMVPIVLIPVLATTMQSAAQLMEGVRALTDGLEQTVRSLAIRTSMVLIASRIAPVRMVLHVIMWQVGWDLLFLLPPPIEINWESRNGDCSGIERSIWMHAKVDIWWIYMFWNLCSTKYGITSVSAADIK